MGDQVSAVRLPTSKLPTSEWLVPEALAVFLLPITGIAVAFALLAIGADKYDMVAYFKPWMAIVQERGLASLSSEFADYTPPYVYLLYAASWLVPLVGTVAAIKLINLPFIALLSVAIYQTVLVSTASRRGAATAAAAACVTPTVVVNAFAWGQTDCIYTAFLAWSVLFAIRRQPAAAAAMFGVSIGFKLLAMFLLPLLLYLILAKQMKVWHLLLVPTAYLLMMVPAAIAGRPWGELVTIYVDQFDFFSKLAIEAPNPWKIIGALELIDYRTGVFIGFAAAAVTTLTIAISALRLQAGARTILLVAALSAALMPYLLPKMHDRYFFVADVMTLTLAFVNPRLWATFPLFQVGSQLAYMPYFHLSLRGPVYAILPITFGVGILTLSYVRAHIGRTASVAQTTPMPAPPFRAMTS
jgi:Gpi18-like mannosyltransferase